LASGTYLEHNTEGTQCRAVVIIASRHGTPGLLSRNRGRTPRQSAPVDEFEVEVPVEEVLDICVAREETFAPPRSMSTTVRTL
jgi:hypothetical protein